MSQQSSLNYNTVHYVSKDMGGFAHHVALNSLQSADGPQSGWKIKKNSGKHKCFNQTTQGGLITSGHILSDRQNELTLKLSRVQINTILP